MNQVVTHLLGVPLFALLLSLASCSGPRGDSPAAKNGGTSTSTPETEGRPNTEAGRSAEVTAKEVQETRGQDQDEVMAQRRKVLIEQTLDQARRAMSNRLWEDAKRAAAGVLELDPTHDEARRILIDAQTFLGERGPTSGREHMDRVIQAEIEKERTRLQALDLERTGDFAVERGDYDAAIESYRRARYMIVYNRFFVPGSEEEKRLDTKLGRAQETRERVAREQAAELAAKSQQRLEEEERQAKIRRQARIRRLFEEANLAFQRERYTEAINLLETALADEPNFGTARELLELAQRARHDQNMDELKRRWKTAWTDTFDEIHASDLIQTESIKYDMARWAEVAKRTPIAFSDQEETDTPEDREVLRILEEKSFPHTFSEAPLDEWTKWYQQATGVNFLVSQKAKEMDPDKTKLRDFRLPRTNVRTALDVISRLTSLQWRVGNGVVNIMSSEEKTGRSYLQYYEVRSLISPVPNYPGRDITLRGQGEEEPQEAEIEPVPTVLTGDQLITLIKDNIEKQSWEGDNSISEQAGTLVVRQTREVHEQLRKLLSDLRDATGVQVDIESRFLRVEDNFLEDIGVDFRGLGNQASEGVPGRGLEKQRPRPGVGFDDFGRRENISPSAPGEIGTGTEPGMFFDDGNDGDLIGRTENLYDNTLGRGGGEGLDNAGGLSLQYVYLDDTELEVVLRAVSKQERVEEVTAPRLLLYNAQRGNLSVTNQFSYIKDFEVEIAQAAAVADPVVGVVKDGVVLDVRPVVSADRKFITIELRPTLATLTQPIPTFTTTLGVGQPISIQLPRLTVQKVRTTVTIPDGGTLMLGGMKSSEKQNMNSGVPFLKDVPVVSFFFSRKGTYIANRKVLILLRASILIPEEHEPKPMVRDEIPLTATRTR